MHQYSFTNGHGKFAQVAHHLDALGVTLLASVLEGDVYTITTDLPVPDNQAEHLGLL